MIVIGYERRLTEQPYHEYIESSRHDNKEDAEEQAYSYGVNSQDAHDTNLDVISVEENKGE